MTHTRLQYLEAGRQSYFLLSSSRVQGFLCQFESEIQTSRSIFQFRFPRFQFLVSGLPVSSLPVPNLQSPNPFNLSEVLIEPFPDPNIPLMDSQEPGWGACGSPLNTCKRPESVCGEFAGHKTGFLSGHRVSFMPHVVAILDKPVSCFLASPLPPTLASCAVRKRSRPGRGAASLQVGPVTRKVLLTR